MLVQLVKYIIMTISHFKDYNKTWNVILKSDLKCKFYNKVKMTGKWNGETKIFSIAFIQPIE